MGSCTELYSGRNNGNAATTTTKSAGPEIPRIASALGRLVPSSKREGRMDTLLLFELIRASESVHTLYETAAYFLCTELPRRVLLGNSVAVSPHSRQPAGS